MNDAIAELRRELVRVELRLTRWTAVCSILTMAVTIMLVFAKEPGPWLWLFTAGTVAQCIAVWQMGSLPDWKD